MTPIDARVYVDGRRTETSGDLQAVVDALGRPGAFAWISLRSPEPEDLEVVAATFGLHPLAVEDARKGHQRAKLEWYGHTMFVVLRPAWYDDAAERVEFGEVHLFVGPDFVVTVRREQRPDITPVRDTVESEPRFLAIGPKAVLTTLLDEIIDEDAPVVAGLENDIDEVEDSLFGGGNVDRVLSERIYRLLEQVIAFQRGIVPLPDMMRQLLEGADAPDSQELSEANPNTAGASTAGLDVSRAADSDEVHNRLRNVLDHTVRVAERVDTCRALLDNALTVHSTLVTMEQNEAMRQMSSASLEQGEQVKRISSWAAILFTPTLVASAYGMNFDHMPELHWLWGYPFALALMVFLGVGLWGIFKWRNWL